MSHETELKKTILHSKHVALGAKMAPFGGFDMPIQYGSLIQEHMAARKAAAVFDTCHMGEFTFSGPDAVADLETLLSCPIASMQVGQCRYGFICNEQGGVIDDQITYRIAEDEFFMVVNASTMEGDFTWISNHLSSDTNANNITNETAKIDLQGPKAPGIMHELMDGPIEGMKFYRFRHNMYKGTQVLTSRTGYTGEIGFEIYCPADLGGDMWDRCIELGATPAGLGARDTLRLEMGMPLYGHELDATTNPAGTGFTRSIAKDKHFIGSAAVHGDNPTRRLVGLELTGRRAARSGDAIVDTAGSSIGAVTSGSFSPSLQKAIALAYLDTEHTRAGTDVQIDTGRQKLDATVVEVPFYKEATGRKPLADFL